MRTFSQAIPKLELGQERNRSDEAESFVEIGQDMMTTEEAVLNANRKVWR